MTNQDIFQTQADNRFNSFSDPLNAVNQNGGQGGGNGWGVDSNYLTPSYLSPFRPQYQGPNGDSSNGFKPGFATSFNQVVNPFAGGGTNYGGNYWAQTTPFYDSLANKPADSLMSGIQHYVAPALFSWASYKALGTLSTKVGSAAASGLMRGLMGSALGASGTSTAMEMAGIAGGFAGSITLPMLAAQGVTSALDSAVMDPYIAQRNTGNSLRDNFRGITFGDSGAGDPYTGGGLSRRTAQAIAKSTSMAGAKDMAFNQKETAQLVDFASRSGLLDNVSASQLSSRFESILKQVKVVMSVANTSDFKETIEIMSKMQMSGVNSSQLNSVMGQMGSGASIGGQSVQKIMNTTGAQGQYMFGAAGLTPYLGQLSAFDSGGAMSSAFRNGLISPGLMARMGGVEGATQSATAAQIASYKTPYANMVASNAYLGGGEQDSVVGNVLAFGGRMAANPLKNIGDHRMNGNALASAHARDEGLFGEAKQVHQIAEALGQLNDKGGVDQGVAYDIMTQNIGMTHEMATAKLVQLASYGNQKTVDAMYAGVKRHSRESMINYQNQEGLNKGIFTGPVNDILKAAYKVQEIGAEGVGNTLGSWSGLADDSQAWWAEARFGIKRGPDDSLSFDKVDKAFKSTKSINFDSEFGQKADFQDRKTSNHLLELKKIQKLADNRDSDALDVINKTGVEQTNAAIKLRERKVISSDYKDEGAIGGLLGLMGKIGTTESKEGERNKSPEAIIKGTLDKIYTGTEEQQIQYMNLMSKAGAKQRNGEDLTDKERSDIAGMVAGKDGKAMLASDVNRDFVTKADANLNRIIDTDGAYNWLNRGVKSAKGLVESLRSTHSNLLEAKLKVGKGDEGAEAARNQAEVQLADARQTEGIRKMVDAHQITPNTGLEIQNALDNKKTAGKFADSVESFGEYVKALPGSKDVGGQPPATPSFSKDAKDGWDKQKNKPRGIFGF